MAATSLLDWVDEQRRKKEEADKKAKADAAKYARQAKDDVYVPPTPTPVIDERKEAVQAKRADIASLQPNKVYIPGVPSQPSNVYLPEISNNPQPTQYGPPPPPPEQNNPIDNSLRAWQTKPTVPEYQYNVPAYKPPQVDFSFQRPDTGTAQISGQAQQPPVSAPLPYTPPIQAPYTPPQTRNFLQANALGTQPYANYATGAQSNMNWLTQAGPAAAASLSNYLQQWQNQQTPEQPQTPQTPAQPPIITGLQRPNTGVPQIGASQAIGGNTAPIATPAYNQQAQQPMPTDWLHTNIQKAVSPISGYNPDLSNLINTTPAEQQYQAQLDKAWQGVDNNNPWAGPIAALKSVGAAANMGPSLVQNINVPGTGVNVGQGLQAGLTVAERYLNPLDTASIYRSQQAQQSPTADALSKENPLLGSLATPFAWMKDTFMQNIQKAQAVNNYIKTLPPDQQQKVQIAYANVMSGPEAMQKTVADILGQGQRVQQYIQQAQQATAIRDNPATPPAQKAQAALDAAKLGAQAQAEKVMSALDYVDKDSHPGANLLGNVLTDPLSFLPIGELVESYKAAKTAAMFDVSPEMAAKVIPQALADTEKILAKATAQPGALADAGTKAGSIFPKTYWEQINPLSKLAQRTPEAQAQMATDKLWNAAAQIVGDVTTKADAQLLVKTWVENPLKLVEGVSGLTSQGAQTVANQGLYKVGAGVVANKPLLDVLPILKIAGDKLQNLQSLVGDAGAVLNKTQLMAELDNVFYDAAKQAYGNAAPQLPADIVQKAATLLGVNAGEALPRGAIKPVLQRLADGTGVISYYTRQGNKLIASGVPEVYANAQASMQALKAAAQGSAASSSGAVKLLNTVSSIQRGILSDMYLNLNPGHWVRNAASATATLLTDGLYRLHSHDEMIGALTSKIGVMPERGLQGAVAGTAEQNIPHWTEKFWPNNPYANLSKAAGNFWGGLATIGGKVPFGEESFKLLAFHNAFQRAFRPVWATPIEEGYREGLHGLGIAPDLAHTIVNKIVEAGVAGSKTDVVTAARDLLSSSTLKPGLRELGVPDELLSMQGWAKLHDVISTHLPDNIEEAKAAVSQIFTNEHLSRAAILNDAPVQLGNPKWMNVEAMHDNASLIDKLREAGQQAGIDPQQVEQTVQQLATKLETAHKNVWETFRNDLGQAPNPQKALQTIFDTYAQHGELTQTARAAVDDMGRKAAYLPFGPARKAAWVEKWSKTLDIYNKLPEDVSKLFDATRSQLSGVATSTQPAYDWFKAIERYVNYDEQTVQAGRTGGLGLTFPTPANAPQWEAAISGNRQFLDKSLLELYDAFRRNPTQESMDLLVNAQQKVEHMGAQAAAYMNTYLKDALAGKLPWDKYYATKGEVWNQFFDNGVLHNKATQRTIIADGVTKQFQGALTWEDPFHGPMRLIAPDTEKLTNATAEAQRLVKAQTGVRQPRRTSFDVWQVADKDGNITKVKDEYVPAEVKAAWQKVVNHDDVVNSVVDDISKTVKVPDLPPTSDFVAQHGGQTATEIAQAKLAAEGSTPVTSLRQMADKAGIRVVDDAGKSVNSDVIKAINEDFKAKGLPRINRLENLTPEQYAAARDAMQARVGKVFPSTETPAAAAPTVAAPMPLAGSPAQEAIGQAQDSVKGLSEARNTLKTQWDRQASATWQLPSLDTLIARYERKGIVNVPENMFEDLYGTTIAGHQINSQTDVEALLTEYAQIKRQATAAAQSAETSAATIEDLHSVAKSAGINTATGAGNPNDQYLLNAINTERRANKLKSITLEQLNRDPALRETSAELLMNRIGPSEGPTIHGPEWNPLGMEKPPEIKPTGTPLQPAAPDLNQIFADNVSKSIQTNGAKAPEIADALGSHMLDKLKAAEQKVMAQLPDILAGKPNTLTDAQRQGAMDLLNQILPHYDNAVATASKGAQDAMNFAMLNFNGRRNFDTLLAQVFPFHYFWSRSALNWAERIAAKPGVIHAYAMSNEAIAQENKQQNLPIRLQGTLPNPVAQFGIGPERIANPLIYAMTLASYAPNAYVNPETAQTDYEKWIMRVQQFTPGLMPAYQAALAAGLDVASPKADGTKRFNLSDYAPQKFIPGINVAGEAYQAITGNTAGQLPGGMGPDYGDKFDPYRLGRAATELAMQQKIDPAIAQYAQQIALNQQNGLPEYDKIPPEFQQAAKDLYPQAASLAAKNRLWADAGRLLTGVPGYPYSPEEANLQKAQSALPKLGYNEWTNPFGSKAAMTEQRAQNPYLAPWESKSALVPSTDSTYQPVEPAVSAQTTSKISAEKAIKQAQALAAEAALTGGGAQDVPQAGAANFLRGTPFAPSKNLTYDEMKQVKAPYKEEIDALQAKYPDAGIEATGNVPKGMNPEERAKWQINQMVFGNAPVDPGPNASADQKNAYEAAKADFDLAQKDPKTVTSPEDKLAIYQARERQESARLDQMDTSANAVFAEQGEPPTGFQQAFKNQTRGQYSSNIISDAYLANVTQAEKDWSYKMSLDNEVANAGRKANLAAVKSALPAETAKLYELYSTMTAGSDEKKAFLKEHPELAEANFIAYNQPQYKELTNKFGPDALAILNNAPKYATGVDYNSLTDAQKAAHNAELAAYEKAHPAYNAIKMWMNGRPHLYQQAPDGQFPAKDFGKDYQEAQRIFGSNVFDALSNYPPKGSSKAAYAAFYQKYPKFKGFFEWQNELKDTPPNYTAATDQNKDKFLDMANWYQGPRPYDSGRQPIGVEPVTQAQTANPQPGGPWNPQATPRALAPDAKPEYKAYQSGAATPPYLAPGGPNATAAAAGPTNNKTAADYAAQSNAAYQESYKKTHGYYPGHSPKAAAYAAARAGVVTEFGDQAAQVWEAYGKLPKGSKARDDYKAAHPELKMYDMAAYNPKEYADAKTLFGDTAWSQWAQAPGYGTGTPAEKAARSAYFDANPTAKLLNAWINGRPSAQGDQTPGAGVTYDFGKDFALAQKQFGPDIWNIFAGYKSSFDKGQKKAYFNQHPQLSQFFSWWYGNNPAMGAGAVNGYGAGGYRSYGGGYGGGFSYTPRHGGGSGAMPPHIQAAKMDQSLAVNPTTPGATQWRPRNIDLSWLQAGQAIGPANLKKWQKY